MTDQELESRARRAYEVQRKSSDKFSLRWDVLSEDERRHWLAVARAVLDEPPADPFEEWWAMIRTAQQELTPKGPCNATDRCTETRRPARKRQRLQENRPTRRGWATSNLPRSVLQAQPAAHTLKYRFLAHKAPMRLALFVEPDVHERLRKRLHARILG